MVQIYGSGFTGATLVTFGGVSNSQFDAMSDTMIMAMPPPHASGAVDVQVTAPSAASPLTPADLYAYNAPGKDRSGDS